MRQPPANPITCQPVVAATRLVVAHGWCVSNSGFLLVVVAAAVCCSHLGLDVLPAPSLSAASSRGRRRHVGVMGAAHAWARAKQGPSKRRHMLRGYR